MGRKRRFYQSRLADQLLTSFGLLLLFAGSTSLGLNYFLHQANLQQELQTKAVSITRSLQIAVKTTAESNHLEQLESIVADYGDLPGVLEVMVLDGYGNTLAHTLPAEADHPITAVHPQLTQWLETANRTSTEIFETTELHQQPILVHILPLKLDASGQKTAPRLVVAMLDLNTIQQESHQSFLIATLGMLGITLGALGVMGVILKKKVLTPLTSLTQQVMNSNEHGDLVITQALPNNEIRWLAETFNHVFQSRYQAEQTLHYRVIWFQNQSVVLNRLAKQRDITEGNFQLAAQAITEATAETLMVDRVSVWLYDEAKNYLNCIDLFAHHLMQPTLRGHSADLSLAVVDYPVYFQAVETSEQPIAVDDVYTDARTLEFIESYLIPLNIQSMLDVPIRVGGRTVGILCIERVGQTYFWTPEDQSFARSIGDIVALSVEARDRKLAEQRLRHQAEDLQKTLQELKRTQAQMIQSEKMSSLGQMVAGVAHEINNPVNFIYGNINLAEGDVKALLDLLQMYQQYYPQPAPEIVRLIDEIDLDFLTTDLPKMLTSMQVGAERIRSIVRSLRTFSRLDEADYKTANVHEGIDSTLLILQHRLKATSLQPAIQIIKHYGKIPEIDCYPGQLNQALLQIISNAIDALQAKMFVPPELSQAEALPTERDAVAISPTITITTQQVAATHIEIQIADNGVGMSPAVQARLFDPFFTTKPVGKGTGLGLSISYQIVVQKHRGRLQCVSTPQQGTTFTLELPIRGEMIFSALERLDLVELGSDLN